ncbi:hypothetical protein PHMEG_00012815 [Phytophthora megakarya]|uniref:Uncharacterized protein n=1 Tax=Phytophthora megakarya TaxID=4795 RepID=A0A225W9B2_9STRA|nr:hypothetical protein PHMEG_00012815 [Phytophthora megakarya]
MSEQEQRAIGSGVMAFDGLYSALKWCLESAGVTSLVYKLTTQPQPSVRLSEETEMSSAK